MSRCRQRSARVCNSLEPPLAGHCRLQTASQSAVSLPSPPTPVTPPATVSAYTRPQSSPARLILPRLLRGRRAWTYQPTWLQTSSQLRRRRQWPVGRSWQQDDEICAQVQGSADDAEGGGSRMTRRSTRPAARRRLVLMTAARRPPSPTTAVCSLCTLPAYLEASGCQD